MSTAGANEKTLTTIYATLHEIEAREIKFSKYRLQQMSKLSLNTIKKALGAKIRAFITKNEDLLVKTLIFDL